MTDRPTDGRCKITASALPGSRAAEHVLRVAPPWFNGSTSLRFSRLHDKTPGIATLRRRKPKLSALVFCI